MKKFTLSEYLKLAFDEKLFFKRSWRIALGMRLFTYDIREDLYPFKEGNAYFTNYRGEVYQIEGRDPNAAFIKWTDKVTIDKGFLPNVTEKTETTLGRLILNAVGFTEEFGDLIPYHNEEFSPKLFNKAIYGLYRKGKIKSASQVRNSTKYIHILEGDAEMGVPAASIETFTVSPEVKKRQRELEIQYAGQLNDPVVQAKIDTELTALDKASHKGTQAEDFLLSGKAYGTVRKKTKLMYGSEVGMDGKPTNLVTRPLSEGLSVDDMPSWVNVARAGSYSRGALTALGGFGVKQDDLAYGHLEIELGKDCKTKKGLDILVDDKSRDMILGMRLLSSNEILDDDAINKLMGKVATIRSPGHCRLEHNYCEYCMGAVSKKGQYIIPGNVSTIDSNSMNAMMSAGHGKSKLLRRMSLSQLC